MTESDKAEVGMGHFRQKEQNLQKQSGRQAWPPAFFSSASKGFWGSDITGGRALQSVGISNPGKHKAPGQHVRTLRTKQSIKQNGNVPRVLFAILLLYLPASASTHLEKNLIFRGSCMHTALGNDE